MNPTSNPSNTSGDDSKEYQEIGQKTLADKERILKELSELQVMLAGHWRDFTSTLLTIDIAVVAALLTAFTSESSTLIQYPLLTLLGILLLVGNAVLIVFYSVSILYNDDDSLAKYKRFYEKTHDAVLTLAQQYAKDRRPYRDFDSAYIDKLVELSQEEKIIADQARVKEKSGKWLYALGGLFVIGLVISALSLVPIAQFVHLGCL